MAERLFKHAVWTRIERALANSEVAEAGNVACIDTSDGTLVAGQVAEGLLPIGVFEESLTGDGTTKVKVRLFAPVEVVALQTESGSAVDDGDVGSFCFLHSPHQVSADGTGKSVAGRVWGVQGTTVWVQMAMATGPQGPQGEAG